MYYVYILLCSDGSYYTGISDDPKRRFLEHIKGKGGRYTRTHIPIKIIYQEKVPTKSDALKREIEIKSRSKKKKIEIVSLPFQSCSRRIKIVS